jgi:hypothetical protein
LVGCGVAATAIAGKFAVQAWKQYQSRPAAAATTFRRLYKGGFEKEMSKSEAALILGIR